ncbi:MAG: hypothetical protein U5L96_05660 [Owenweeksia sp.]|nr:hypothetical protein [Owenweeksia sp.]
MLKRLSRALALPLLDTGLLLAGLHYIKEYWEHNHRFIVGGEYPLELVWTAFPLYTLTWIISMYLTGGYDRPTRIANLLKGIAIGTVVILVGYSLVDESVRFSRAIIILGFFWAALVVPLSRMFLQNVFGARLIAVGQYNRRVLIVGSVAEASRVEGLVKQTNNRISYLAFGSPHRPKGK